MVNLLWRKALSDLLYYKFCLGEVTFQTVKLGNHLKCLNNVRLIFSIESPSIASYKLLSPKSNGMTCINAFCDLPKFIHFGTPVK